MMARSSKMAERRAMLMKPGDMPIKVDHLFLVFLVLLGEMTIYLVFLMSPLWCYIIDTSEDIDEKNTRRVPNRSSSSLADAGLVSLRFGAEREITHWQMLKIRLFYTREQVLYPTDNLMGESTLSFVSLTHTQKNDTRPPTFSSLIVVEASGTFS